MDELKELYYNKEKGLLSLEKLYQKAKSEGINVKRKDVEIFLKSQETDQIYRKRRAKYDYPLIANTPGERFQVDLMDMSNEAQRNFKWVMNVVDVYTRFAFSRPLKNKTTPECLRAFQEILEDIIDVFSFPPTQFDSDMEPAFLSAQFQSLLKENNIAHKLSPINDVRSRGVVERFNKTVRLMFGKYKTTFGMNWLDALPYVIQNYNHTIHSTLKNTPSDEIENQPYDHIGVRKAKAEQQPFTQIPLTVGDRVRLKIRRTKFQKERPPWTSTIHTIDRIDGVLFYVSDRQKPYRKPELKKIDVEPEQFRPVANEERKQEVDEVERRRVERRANDFLRQEGINQQNVVLRNRRPDGRNGVLNNNQANRLLRIDGIEQSNVVPGRRVRVARN